MSSARHRYLPALDGLRACAVTGVLLYHAGISWAAGGFLGVDLFFVLSGFLITSLLLGEKSATGRIALGAFWARRARRLLPALFLVLGAVVLYGGFLAAPDELRHIRSDSLASLGYVANWHFIASGQSYFEQFLAPSPLKHMWSLAIEEQFYLLWPLLVFAVLRWRRSNVRALATVTAGLATASVLLMAGLHTGGDPSRVYYGTDTRAQSLLVGALLAMLLANRPDVVRPAARAALQGSAVAAAVVLGWWWSTVSDHTSWLYEGGFLVQALLVAVVITAVVQQRQGLLGAVLSFRPVRWIGAISYGLYLWHWPVYVALDETRTGLDGTALILVRLGTTLAVATASYYLVERPIRYGALRGWRVRLAIPTAVTTVAVALLLVTAGAPPAPVEVAASDLTPPSTATISTVAAAAVRQPTRVLFVGDSVANSTAPGLERLAQREGFVVWNAAIPGCGLAGDTSDIWIGRWEPENGRCHPGWRERWPQHLAEFHPDVVVALFGTHDTFDRRVNGQMVRFDSPEGTDLALRDLQDAVNVLTSSGARLVLLTSPYFVQGWRMQIVQGRSFLNSAWIDHWNDIVREIGARNPGRVEVADLNGFLDPGGHWTDSINGVPVRIADKMHLTDAAADMVARWLAPSLHALGPGSSPLGIRPEPVLRTAALAAVG